MRRNHRARAQASEQTSLNRYRSVWEMRSDGWVHLADSAALLAEAFGGKGDLDLARARVEQALAVLEPIENYWAFPGRQGFRRLLDLFEGGEYGPCNELVRRMSRALSTQSFRRNFVSLRLDEEEEHEDEQREADAHMDRPYFEVLVVDDLGDEEEEALRERMRRMRRPEDAFVYEHRRGAELRGCADRVAAPTSTCRRQSSASAFRSSRSISSTCCASSSKGWRTPASKTCRRASAAACSAPRLRWLRPEMDLYIVTEVSIEEIAGKLSRPTSCASSIARKTSCELHLQHPARRRAHRYETPFFTALQEYSRQPTGVFHAMPISRGKSIIKSHWIQDMVQFYGLNIFLAETSATSGGLDSLLEPVGPIKKAQELAARAFGAQRTYFVDQRHLDREQDRRAGAGAARRHRAGRPQLPQVAPLRPGAGGRATWSISTPIRSTATRCTARCRWPTSSAACSSSARPASSSGSSCCC